MRPEGLIVAPAGNDPTPRLRWLARAALVVRGLPKTLAFNFRYLPLRQAVRLPVLVSHRVALLDFSGGVTLDDPVRPATVLLGFGSNGAFDYRRSRSVWQVAGRVTFEGPARLGNGFKLSVGIDGHVTFGPDFVLSAESQIVCRESVRFGRGCLLSWDVLILDSDFHPILADDGEAGPQDAPIALGDRVWIGARSTVLKGVRLEDDVVIAAASVVTRSEPASNVLLGGHPARVLRTGVSWSHRPGAD
jgi:acetyltransferase-like isoleucine patch superfamily enzyme